MSIPKCLFFQDLEGLTEVFGGMSARMSGRKLPLWAEFSFLTFGKSLVFGNKPNTVRRVRFQTPSSVSFSSKKGREKKGPPDIAPKSFSQKGPKWCSALSIGVIGKSALEIGHFLRRNFWMISGGPIPLPTPLLYC